MTKAVTPPKKVKKSKSPISSSPPAHKPDWQTLVEALKNKDDYKVRYFCSGNQHNQADRDWVAQAAVYYNGRTKRQPCPTQEVVTAELPHFVQGYTEDLNAISAPIVTFKTAKHILGFMKYLTSARHLHHDIVVQVSVDDSPFLEVI
eukprot:gene31514-38087_t